MELRAALGKQSCGEETREINKRICGKIQSFKSFNDCLCKLRSEALKIINLGPSVNSQSQLCNVYYYI